MELTGDWLLDYFLIKKKGKQEVCNLIKLTFHETGNGFKYQGIHQQSHLPFQ